MATRDEFADMLAREPFQPFRVLTTSGETYTVTNPGMAVPMATRLFIALAERDRWTLIPYLHVSAVESVGNGHPRRPARRKRRP